MTLGFCVRRIRNMGSHPRKIPGTSPASRAPSRSGRDFTVAKCPSNCSVASCVPARTPKTSFSILSPAARRPLRSRKSWVAASSVLSYPTNMPNSVASDSPRRTSAIDSKAPRNPRSAPRRPDSPKARRVSKDDPQQEFEFTK